MKVWVLFSYESDSSGTPKALRVYDCEERAESDKKLIEDVIPMRRLGISESELVETSVGPAYA